MSQRVRPQMAAALRGTRRLAMWPVLLALLPLSCARPTSSTSDPVRADQRDLPFRQDNQSSSPSRDAALSPPKAESHIPFSDSEDLPTGTLLTVRLTKAVSGDHPGSGVSFAAVVDEPVRLKGNTKLPRGVDVSGLVEAAGSSDVKRDRSYVRLTLQTIDFDGSEIPVQTTSLFVRSSIAQTQNGASSAPPIRLEAGRRLTFRLTEPVWLEGPITTEH